MIATASAQFTTAALAAGSHSITATYDPTAGTPASSASLTEVITGIATTAALSSSLNPAPYGQSVTFTASVSSSSSAPTGTIQFMDGASVLGTLPLAPSGTTTSSATLASSSLSPGTHSLSAVYNGSGELAPSSAIGTYSALNMVNSLSSPVLKNSIHDVRQTRNALLHGTNPVPPLVLEQATTLLKEHIIPELKKLTIASKHSARGVPFDLKRKVKKDIKP
jgi:hypothetical protein